MAHPRRSFLGLVGLGALATTGVVAGGGALAGCTSKPSGSGTSTNVNKLDALLPKYQPVDLARPDIVVPPPAAPGYLTYPSTLVDAIKDKPDKGGSVIKVTTLNWGAVLYQLGKTFTKPDQGVWAFSDITDHVQMVFRVPGSKGGWRAENGKVVNKIETPEFMAALEFTAKLFKENMIHPDLAGSKGADAAQLFKSGKIVFRQDGLGGWQNTYRDQLKVDPNFKMQPTAVFANDGKAPLVWGSADPIFYTFIKKGLGKARTEEILGCLNWCAAPYGTKEWELRQYGVEGLHFTRGSDNVPKTNDLYNNEYANQYTFMSGRTAAITGGSDTPNFVQDYTTWTKNAVQFLEANPWAGIKMEDPVKLAQLNTPTQDKIKDVVRGRTPLSEWSSYVDSWRKNGGDEGRDFYAKALNA